MKSPRNTLLRLTLRAILVLQRRRLGVDALAADLGIHRRTAYRILGALRSEGLPLVRDRHATYTLTSEAISADGWPPSRIRDSLPWGTQSKIARSIGQTPQMVSCIVAKRARAARIEEAIAQVIGRPREEIFGPAKPTGKPLSVPGERLARMLKM